MVWVARWDNIDGRVKASTPKDTEHKYCWTEF